MRFLLFRGSHHYPAGGWNDFAGSFDTIDEAEKHFQQLTYWRDWYHIVDINSGKIVRKVTDTTEDGDEV